MSEYLEKLKTIGGIVKGGTPKFYSHGHKDMTSIYQDLNNPLAEITKDKAMFKTIMHGNASDKKLTADVTAIERERVDKKKQKARQEKLTRIQKLKSEYRKKYGKEA